MRRRVFPAEAIKRTARAVAEELMATYPGFEVTPHEEGREAGSNGLPHHLPGAVESDLKPLRGVRKDRAAKRRAHRD
jgi:hypothetical protein